MHHIVGTYWKKVILRAEPLTNREMVGLTTAGVQLSMAVVAWRERLSLLDSILNKRLPVPEGYTLDQVAKGYYQCEDRIKQAEGMLDDIAMIQQKSRELTEVCA